VANSGNTFIQIVGPGVNADNEAVPTTVGGSASSSGTGTLTGTWSPGPTNNAGTYNVTYGIRGATSPVTCSGSFPVAYSPYYQIQGGDVAAGPGFGNACTSGTGSQIKGENLGSSDGYYGASNQLAGLALGTLDGFATNTTLNTATNQGAASAATVAPAWGLSFANTGAGGAVWGKNFAKTPADDPADNPSWCVPDYAGTAASATPAPAALLGVSSGPVTLNQTGLDSLTSGKTYVVNGTLTITGGLKLGGSSGGLPSRITIIVNGDAIVGSSVAYNGYTTGTADVGAIPQFQLLVKGNIYIGRLVLNLAGFYAAQPTNATNGVIYTCSSGSKYITGVTGDAASNAKVSATYYNDCDDPLTVTGSLSARSIKLLRTGGNLRTSGAVTNRPAENIIYPPELWMGNLRGVSGGTQPYDAITSLPPIL
jgi:hypothetical protein